MSRWKKFRYQIESLGVELLARAIPCLPRQACVLLGKVLGELAFRLDERGRTVALANLECAFGDRYSPAEREALARASYRNFLRTMLDLFWSVNLTAENWRRWISTEGMEAISERVDRENRGVVLVCIHQGNWEWASLAWGLHGRGTTIVAENFKNSHLTAIFNRLRERTGHAIIPQENSLLRMLKIVKRRGWTGMLIDLNVRPTQAATVIEAFGSPGLKMCVPLLHAVLAQRANALFVPVECQPRDDGTCHIVVHPGIEFPADATLQEISQRCWDACEPFLLDRPGEWLWAYKHFRYRPKDAARPYPAYSNVSGKFERLLREIESASA